MMTKNKTTTKTTHKTSTKTLTGLEENVVRMRRGYGVPHDLALETKDGGNAEVAKKLREIETRALRLAGRQPSDAKRKIIAALRSK